MMRHRIVRVQDYRSAQTGQVLEKIKSLAADGVENSRGGHDCSRTVRIALTLETMDGPFFKIPCPIVFYLTMS